MYTAQQSYDYFIQISMDLNGSYLELGINS